MKPGKLLYVGPGGTPHDARFIHALTRHGWTVKKAGVAALETPAATTAAVERAVAAALEVERPDVTFAGPVPTHARGAARAGAAPLIAVSWGSDMLLDAKCDSAVSALAREALDAADAVVGDCAAVLREVASYRAFPPEAVLEVPWGVDRGHFFPAPDGRCLRTRFGWGEHEFVVVSNRTMARLYRVDTVVRGFAAAHRQCPRLRLLLVGDGPLLPEIRALIEDEKIQDVVHLAGRVPERDLASLFNVSDLYVSASESDGSSISLLQAMACGLAVAVTALPSNAEWIAANETGWLFPSGDFSALADTILCAEAQSAASREAVKRRNLQTIEARADWEVNAARLSAFCESVAQAHAGRPA